MYVHLHVYNVQYMYSTAPSAEVRGGAVWYRSVPLRRVPGGSCHDAWGAARLRVLVVLRDLPVRCLGLGGR